MATASQTVEPNEKECSVCHEDFTDPKVLPCGHLLCRHCLLSWLNTQTDAHCPLCRCAIVEPTADTVSFEDVADSFPTDLAMKAVVDADRILNKDHSCCVCEDVAATSMCLDCGDMLCTACKKAHGKLSMTKHHTVEDLSSLTAEKLAEKQQETCDVHTNELSKVYCPTHGTSICLLCATTDHRQCPDVTKLETKAEEARATLQELAAILSAGEAALDRAIAQLDDHLQETEKRTKAAIAEIQEMCDRLEAAVKACRHRMTKLAESACDDVKEAVQDGKTRLLSRRGKLTSHKRVVERSQGKTTRATLTTMAVTMKTRVVTLDCSATLPPDAKTINSVTLTIDREAVARVEQELRDLGQMKMVPAAIAAQELRDLGKVTRVPATVAAQKCQFLFHNHHGEEILLSDCHLTAERKSFAGTSADGVVISSKPMEVSQLYEVRLDERSQGFSGTMPLGVVTSSRLYDVTRSNDLLHCKSTIGVWNSFVYKHGVTTASQLGNKIANMPEGSRVGLCLDSDRTLFLFYNGKRVGTVATSVPQPAYAFFVIRDVYTKITALPLTTME